LKAPLVVIEVFRGLPSGTERLMRDAMPIQLRLRHSKRTAPD
jgi:hypothetical protein